MDLEVGILFAMRSALIGRYRPDSIFLDAQYFVWGQFQVS